ncbi:hypothetical protein MFLAVUS_000261 [Mucor flavus]|uniref:C2H2-type domain-containing protein n=1 Tax=Mucor flavus TaxID=439312 RepID=A0ABP9YJ89_9FUNG
MNSTSNYCLDSISRRSSLCPPHHDSDPVLSPPLTPAMSQHHPFDKRQSTDLSSYPPNHYNTRPAYSIDSYHHWMNHSATIQHMQQQQQQQVHHPMHQQQVHPIPSQNQQPQQQPQQQQHQQQRSLMTDRAAAAAACSTRKQPSKQNKHMCNFPECLWSFKRYEHLKRHMLVHTGERPHVCPHPGCGKRFSRSDNFHAHYRTHEKKAFARQKNTNNNNHTLQDNSTSSSSSTTTPTSNSSFMMKEEKDFNNNNNTSAMQPYYHHHHPYPLLPTPSNKPTDYMYNQQHYSNMLQDNSPTPSSRSVLHNNNSISSSSSSSTSSSNKSSTLKGEQKKPHACSHPNCERQFRRLEHLKRHMRIHTHEQPFKCTFPGCLKAFSRSDNLTQHRKTHDRRGSRYQVVDPAVPAQPEFMHAPNNNNTTENSFTLVDFIRDGHTNYNHQHQASSPSFDNSNKSHSILGWQHPGDTSTESVGC